MPKPYDPFDDDSGPVAPECRATVELVQAVLDGEAAPAALDADPHAGACATCRERARGARVLLSVLDAPSEPVPVPVDFADRVLRALGRAEWAEVRRPAPRRATASAVGWAALVVAVLVAAFIVALRPTPKGGTGDTADMAGGAPRRAEPRRPEAAPAPHEKSPDPSPLHIGDEVAKAGQVLRDAPTPIADSVAVAPKLFDAFAEVLARSGPVAPMGDTLEPARKSLAELPAAARRGLEPVTDTAQKAIERLLRDVASVKPSS